MNNKLSSLVTAHRSWGAVITICVLIVVILVWRSFGQPTVVPVVQAKTVAGTFRPTKEQWTGLKVDEVRTRMFRSILSTDGAIAFNDDRMTPVFSPYSGRVTRLIAKPGDVVKKGELLLALEASEFVQAKNDLAVASANLVTLRSTEKRQRELFEAGAGAQKDWRQAQSDLAVAEATYAAARGRLRIQGKSDADIDALAKVSTDSVEALVVAPITGTITQRQVGVGQYIMSAASGATNPIYTIGDLATVWLVANVRETDSPRVRVGQSTEVSVLALPGQVFKGRVSWIGTTVDPATHRLPVRVEVKNPEGFLKPQMFASFSIATSGEMNAPGVPASAVIYDEGITRVYVANDDATVAARAIRAGRSLNGMIEVLDGLKAGDKVITAGTLFIDRAATGD
jgi:membrane fusion protein, heavy metal efflux system